MLQHPGLNVTADAGRCANRAFCISSRSRFTSSLARPSRINPMVAEVFAGFGALKTAFDIAKGLKDIDDAARRNAAIIELQEKILSAEQSQSALIERVHDLEKEVAGFEQWEAEKKRYALTDFGGNS